MPASRKKQTKSEKKTVTTRKVHKCPSCGKALEKVGQIKADKSPVYLCHDERKAFKGQPPVMFEASSKTRVPSIYESITGKNEPVINIEDIVLTKS